MDEEEDVQLVYASVNGLKLNPQLPKLGNPLYADHCFVERTTKEGQHLIYDTSLGLVYDKAFYWKIEHPIVRKVDDKDSIRKMVEFNQNRHLESFERDKNYALLIVPVLEMFYGEPTEFYSRLGVELLQREVELFKREINYDEESQKLDEEMKILRFKR